MSKKNKWNFRFGDDDYLKTEEAEIKGSQFIKLFPLDEKSPHYVTGAAKSLCYIETPDKKASGFLIKFMMNYKDFYCLMTNEHVVEEKLVKNRDIITFYFDNKNKSRRIILDKNNRLIKHFKNDLTIDATVIEILPKDNIPNDYFLIADSYYMNKNNFEKLKGKEITILQYPSGKYDEGKYSTGKLIEIFGDDKNKYEFSHSASTFRGSSGSPIFLKKNTVKIIGIHKSGVSSLKNYGDFIGPIYNYFKYYLSNIKDIYNNDRKGEKLAENPKNNNSTDSFYIRSPKVLSVKKEFEVWDCVIQESHAFLEEHDLKCRAYPFTQDKIHNMMCCVYEPVYAFIEESVCKYRVNESSVTFRYKEELLSVWISMAKDFCRFLKEWRLFLLIVRKRILRL